MDQFAYGNRLPLVNYLMHAGQGQRGYRSYSPEIIVSIVDCIDCSSNLLYEPAFRGSFHKDYFEYGNRFARKYPWYGKRFEKLINLSILTIFLHYSSHVENTTLLGFSLWQERKWWGILVNLSVLVTFRTPVTSWRYSNNNVSEADMPYSRQY